MTTIAQFLTMDFVSSRVEVDAQGNLVRIETRKCDRTGLKLTHTYPVPASKEYLTAASAE